METTSIEIEALRLLRDAAFEILDPLSGECLLCFINRQLIEFGCNGTHRFTEYYRDQRAPRATALIRRLARMGACCCECEIFFNGYQPARHIGRRERWMGFHDDGERPQTTQHLQEMPPCRGVRRGSTQACCNWERMQRGAS